MRELILFFAALCLCGCARPPESYAPPPQQPSLYLSGPGGLAHFVAMNQPDASAYIVRDISPTGDPGGWRWAWRHPELRFWLPVSRDLKFHLDFVLPGAVLRQTGSMTLSFSINGRPLGSTRVDKDGQNSFEKAVPPEMLIAGGVNTVQIEPDRTFLSPADGQALSIVIARAGFVD